MDLTVGLLWCILALIFFNFYRTRAESMKIFRKMNIPGPNPNFLFGNLLGFAKKPSAYANPERKHAGQRLLKQAFYDTYLDWYYIYGKTFGYFEGLRPVLVTADLDVLHQVMVKKFDVFHARKVFPVQVDPDKDEEVHMFFARGDRWKRLRAISNPAFTNAKIRKMSPLVHKCIDRVIHLLRKKAETNSEVEMYDIFQRLTLDSMANCGFGFCTSAIENPNDIFLKKCRHVLENTTKPSVYFLLGFLFPGIDKFLIRVAALQDRIFGNPVFWLEKQFEKIVKLRKECEMGDKQDLLNMMIEANQKTYSADDIMTESKASMSKFKYQKLTALELRSQCFLFLMAGYETTATTLIYLAYELACNQDIQTRLYEEIIEHFPNEEDEISFDDLNKLDYLDKIWHETLRKYPLASTVIARQAEVTCAVSDTLSIPKGMIVQANVWAIHHDPQIWGPDPDKFNPERFVPEEVSRRHPMAYLPFGAGPRQCIGIRFAMMEGKFAIVKILRNFHIILSENQGTLKTIEGATIAPHGGVLCRLFSRQSTSNSDNVSGE